MNTSYLTQEERNLLFSKLSYKQQHYLQEFLKRGKKTVFASILAQQKGGYSEPESTHISTQWTLLDCIDAGTVSNELKCECGRSLRYQYIVKNLVTGRTLKFGKSHFQEHTGIPAEIVSEVLRGMSKIDYELDEILLKHKEKWSLEIHEGITFIPSEYSIPSDIQELLNLELPLLQRQVNRLIEIIKTNKQPSFLEIPITTQENTHQNEKNQISLFENETPHYNKSSKEFYQNSKEKIFLHDYLTFEEKDYIMTYLKDHDTVSTRQLCEFLIRDMRSYDKRYMSGKPQLYAYVASYLDDLHTRGVVCFSKNNDFRDRIYVSSMIGNEEVGVVL